MGGDRLRGSSYVIDVVIQPALVVAMKKAWDVVPPFGWNWSDDDWRMHNFIRGLGSHGGVVGDTATLLLVDRKKPSHSRLIKETITDG